MELIIKAFQSQAVERQQPGVRIKIVNKIMTAIINLIFQQLACTVFVGINPIKTALSQARYKRTLFKESILNDSCLQSPFLWLSQINSFINLQRQQNCKMGNYALNGKKGKSQPKLNSQTIDQQNVYDVQCLKCQSELTKRGCKINLASSLKLQGYSSDKAPETIQLAKELEKCKSCDCLVAQMFCKACSKYCGFRVVYLCKFCQTQPINGHSYLFFQVKGKLRQEKWLSIVSELPQKPKFQQLLTWMGLTPDTLEILKKENITSTAHLEQISNEMLKQAGISLGDIAKLRKFK